MTSAFAQDGFCFTVSGASTPLPTPYSVAKPATATAAEAQYSSAAASWFIAHLNVPDWGICGKNGSLAVHLADATTTHFVNVAVPTVLGAVSPSSSTATSAISYSSPSATASTGLSTSAKAAIGVGVPVIVLAVVVSGLILWFTYRRRRVARMERRVEENLRREMEGDI